jgi:WD40 repeat protein/transcriptional regulator with XRE-family HTH domain
MTEQPAQGFAGLLRRLRAAVRLTQEELAEAAGLSPRSVSDLERGINRTARKDTAESLAGALGLAEPVRAVFVAAARGRADTTDVLAAMDEEARRSAAAEDPAATRGAAWLGCPYLGLMPFQEPDARIYYGRDELVTGLVQRLMGRLDRGGILLVAGESGAGKSSLLRAGLIPRLAAGALGPGSDRWPWRVIRPTDNPLRELATALADVAHADADSVYRSLSAAPAEAPMLVELAVRTGTGRGAHAESGGLPDSAPAAAPRLVLIVDQFEELFTAGGDTEADRVEREGFITALHAAASGSAGPRQLPPALVILSIRADFLGRLIAYPPLKAALDAGPFTVGPMSEAELRLAMTGPAAEADLAIEPALVEAAIAELGEGAAAELGSGILPLISQAMATTWEHREGDELTLRAYRRAGGVAYAVNHSAQAAYYALTDRQQDAARLVFTQLTVLTADGRFERRRCRRTDLSAPGTLIRADVDAVIEIFSAHRLLTLGQVTVEISHDVLFQAWKQLRDWLGDDRLDRVLYSQIVTDAFIWDGNGRDPSYLYRPGRLATIDAASGRWRAAPTRHAPLPATSMDFLDAARHAARRSIRGRRVMIAGLLALTVIAISTAGAAVLDAATASREHATSLSRQLAVESLAIDASDPVTARRLAVAAWSVSHTPEARSAMAALLTEQQHGGILAADPSAYPVIGVAFSQDGTLLASADADGTVRLWNPATGQAIGAPLRVGRAVNAVAFSRDGKLLASTDADGTVRLWKLGTRQPVSSPLLTGSTSRVNAVAFSPHGNLLAVATGEGIVQLWNPATGLEVGPPLQADSGSPSAVNAVAFSPDGTMLATADGDGLVRLWSLATRRAVGVPLRAAASAVLGVAFSPDGTLLVSADADGTVQLWNPATDQAVGAPLPADTGPGGGVLGVAFSPDGTLLASADADGTVQLWNPATDQAVGAPLPADTGPGGGVLGVAFSPDGTLLASADADGTVRTWHVLLFANPYAALCADVGPPTKAEWTQYAPGETQPNICSLGCQ